ANPRRQPRGRCNSSRRPASCSRGDVCRGEKSSVVPEYSALEVRQLLRSTVGGVSVRPALEALQPLLRCRISCVKGSHELTKALVIVLKAAVGRLELHRLSHHSSFSQAMI